jgi:hypothetical protein
MMSMVIWLRWFAMVLNSSTPCSNISLPMRSWKSFWNIAISQDWRYEDFFTISSIDELNIKKQLAKVLGIAFGEENKGCRFADPVGNVPALTPQLVEASWKQYSTQRDVVASNNMQIEAKEVSLAAVRSMTMTVSGLQIAWSTSSWLNIGYISKWGDDHLDHWDETVERRAGSFDKYTDFTMQRFVLTNRSSLYALLAKVVFMYFTTGAVGAAAAHAFTRLRVILQFDLSAEVRSGDMPIIRWRPAY